MKLQQLVVALDAQIVANDIIGAFQKYAADHCVTSSNDHDKTTSKAQKLEALRWFFDNIARTNQIKLVNSNVGDNVSESQFVFDFTNRQGEPLQFSEVIRRTWQNDQIVEEVYLLGATLEPVAPKKTAAKESATKAVKETAPKAIKETATKSGKPKADKKPATKVAKGEVKAGK